MNENTLGELLTLLRSEGRDPGDQSRKIEALTQAVFDLFLEVEALRAELRREREDRKRENEGIKMFLLAVSDPLYRLPDRSYLNAGVCAKRKNDFNEAEGYLRNAIRLQPQNFQALYQLAEIAFARKNYGEARAYLQRLAPVARGSAEALWLMLRTERMGGDPAAVEAHLAHAAARAGTEPRIAYARAWLADAKTATVHPRQPVEASSPYPDALAATWTALAATPDLAGDA